MDDEAMDLRIQLGTEIGRVRGLMRGMQRKLTAKLSQKYMGADVERAQAMIDARSTNLGEMRAAMAALESWGRKGGEA